MNTKYTRLFRKPEYINKYFAIAGMTTIKMAGKPVKLQKENPAGCAGEGKQSKGN